MYNHLNGKLIEKNPTHLIIECGGIGFLTQISLFTFEHLNDEESQKILLHHQITEDAQTFWGFATEEERTIFRLLISVSGVGCNTARMMLSGMNPDEIAECIASSQIARLKSIKGIGEKTAQRLVVELKDKVSKVNSGTTLLNTGSKTRDEACTALVMLGFNKASVDKIIDQLIKSEASLTTEELIKRALKSL